MKHHCPDNLLSLRRAGCRGNALETIGTPIGSKAIALEPIGTPTVSKTNGRSAVESQETEIHVCKKTQVIFIVQYRLGTNYNFIKYY